MCRFSDRIKNIILNIWFVGSVIKSSSAVPCDPVHPSRSFIWEGRELTLNWWPGWASKCCTQALLIVLIQRINYFTFAKIKARCDINENRKAEDSRTSGYQHWCWLPHSTGAAPWSSLSSAHRLCIECLCEGGFDLQNEPDLFAVF